ncbi:MAG: LacI family DNA-binding transcriptional regulator, partial [Propionibacteriaceae bacterium]|nr:LacI family DNA-binding transcriptional regulator [Propionibacteriaceae bacterium]
MTTLRDIANHLGLSVSTVSRALSGTGRVGDETVARVLEYTRQIDYHPNQLAKGLKLQESRTIGVVVPDISNEFYALLFKEIDARLAPLGYTPVLFDIGENAEREEAFLGHLRSSTVDGMIVATAGSPAYAGLPESLRRRLVFVDNRPAAPGEWTYVQVDNVKSSFVLTKHLIDRGHTRIAMVMGPAAESSASEREIGFRDAMRERGL